MAQTTDAGSDAGSAATPCTFGAWTVNPVDRFAAINTSDTEWGEELSADGLTVVFGRVSVPDQQALFIAHRDTRDADFPAATPITELNNEASNNPRDPALSADQREMYFTADDPDTAATCLYVARHDDASGPWSASINTTICVPQSDDIGGAYLSRDGLRMYYDRNQSGTRRPWLTSRPTTAAPFTDGGAIIDSLPINLGWCTLTTDELTIFCEADLASEKVQIWTATRSSLGAPFSTAGPMPALDGDLNRDGDPSISADGTELVISSDTNLRELIRTCD